MPVSAALVEFLMAEGLSGDKLVTAIRLAEGSKPASSGAARQAKYRANLRGEVTESDVTVTRNSDASLGENPPQRVLSNPLNPHYVRRIYLRDGQLGFASGKLIPNDLATLGNQRKRNSTVGSNLGLIPKP